MGVLDFFFGRTKPTPTTTTTVQSSKLPEEIAPYVTQVLEEAKAQYDIAKERGYQPYPGETIAKRTPEEEAAIAGLRGLIGTQQPYQEEAETALRGIGTEFTADQAEKFMSPYQQAVVDVEKRKAEEDFRRRVMPEFEKQAVGAGGMSGLGSRAGVQAALLGSEFSQQLGDIQTKGQQKAYEDAYRQFTDQAVRQRAQAEDLRGMGLQKFQTGLAEQGLGQELAQADRQEAQSVLDKAFKEYTEQEQYPESELAQLSSFVYGNPFLQTPDRTTTKSGMLQPTSSIGQGLLGLGLTGLNIYGRGLGANNQFSMANVGRSYLGKKYGGRVVQRQEGGEVPNVYSQGQQTTASPMMGSRGGLGSLFGFRFPRRQANVIENIDNAAGSLNDYKETMDENMQNLRMATQAIGSSYNNTFGDRLNLLRRIAGPQQATPTVAEMKGGGGLGSLPVVKREMSGPVDDTTMIEQLLEQDRQIDALSSRNILPTSGQSSLLNTLKQLEGTYPEFSKYLSGEAARRDAGERKTLRESQIKRLKAAMPQQDRFVGLAEAAKRVMGADPSKGFINALVEGMSGLDEGQREAYLKQKEQELKLLELELEGEESDLKAKQEARKEGATLPLKLAKIAKDLKPDLAKLTPTALKYLENQANKKFGISVTVDDAGNFRMRKGEKFVDPEQSEEVFEYLRDGIRTYAALLKAGFDEPSALGEAFPESSKPKDSGDKKDSSSSETSNPPPVTPKVKPTNVNRNKYILRPKTSV